MRNLVVVGVIDSENISVTQSTEGGIGYVREALISVTIRINVSKRNLGVILVSKGWVPWRIRVVGLFLEGQLGFGKVNSMLNDRFKVTSDRRWLFSWVL